MKYLLILLFAISCTPQKRMQRLLRKHPNLISVVDRDTTIRGVIYEIDTIISKDIRDSFIFKTDTIYDTEDYSIEFYGDTLKLWLKPDTMFLPDSVPYAVEVKVKGEALTVYKKRSFIWYLLPLLVGFFLALLFKPK